MRLGELLIREKLITPPALEEALEAQVVHGGRLGTNLLELGLLSEPDLARMLGQLHGCAHASGEMTPDAQALALVDLNDADDKDYLPMRADATRLSLAVINPKDLSTLDAVAFKTGKRVVPVIIPEFRMHQLLRRYCKAFRPLRAIDMNAVRPPRPAQGASDGPVKPTKVAELISEEEFESVYAQALTGGARSELINELLEEEEIITGEEVAAEEEEIITGEVVEEAPRPEVYAPPPTAPQPPERPTVPMWTVPEAPPAPVERPTMPMWTVPETPAAPVERPTLPMFPMPAEAPPAAGAPLSESAPPVPDYAMPSAAPVPPRASPGPARPPEPLPFIPAPTETPARRPAAGFIPVPSDAQAGPRPAQPRAALPPVAPPAQAPVAAAKPAATTPGKAAPRRPATTAAKPAIKPLTFVDAQAQLAKSLDREDVATTVLRYAVSKWRRCLLLSVQGSLVTGWHGMGRGVRDAAVRRIGVALREQNTFRLVRDTRSHYIGPVRRDTAMNVFYRLLGADKRPEPPFPKTAVILPLLVRGKVVHLLYLDNGPEQLTTPDVGELLILAQSVGRSYEAMIRRRKSA
ncbi:MAG: hypothetical protein ACJ8AT_03100 [Hyalangium sp.]|uniref:GspE/PulE/PilB domain-containing protein n=1 Tax=Hyalangium sp. TaxID=2028555 RepID=UPI00389A728B